MWHQTGAHCHARRSGANCHFYAASRRSRAPNVGRQRHLKSLLMRREQWNSTETACEDEHLMDNPETLELQPLLEYASVRAWLDGLRQHWGGDPANDDPERLPMLDAFCRYANRDPD